MAREARQQAARDGLPVQVLQADAQQIPLAANSVDHALASHMLYHVPDLDRGLAEVRRVLRPGGLFVAVTNGDEHTADLRREAGGGPVVTAFSTENGAAALRRHFAEVVQENVATRAVFEDHAAAAAYLATTDQALADALPRFDGPRTYAGATTVFLAR